MPMAAIARQRCPHRWSLAGLLAAGAGSPASRSGPTDGLAAAVTIGDAHSGSPARRDAGRSSARPRHRRQPPGRAVPAVPFRRRSRRSASRATSRPTSPAPATRWTAAQLRLRIVDPQSPQPATPSCRRTIAVDGLTRVGAACAGQADPRRAADRGRGRVPADAAGLTDDASRASPRLVSRRAAQLARWRGRRACAC